MEKSDFVKLVEVDSRLRVKCTCHQTSAEVKYIFLHVHKYTADAEPRWMWYDSGNSIYLKCKLLMDGALMRTCMMENDVCCVTLECDSKRGDKFTQIKHSKVVFKIIKFGVCLTTRDSVCYTSLLSSCIMLYLVYRKWQNVRGESWQWAHTCKVNRCPRKRAMSPWFIAFEKIINFWSAVLHPCLCRQFPCTIENGSFRKWRLKG